VAPLPKAALIPAAVVAIAALTAAITSGDDAYRCGIHSSMTGTVVVKP